MRTLLMLSVALCCALTQAQTNPSDHYVQGYYRANGTWVEGYYATDPNSTINDNYSTYPNYNPYTGQQGRVNSDYSQPTFTQPTYQQVYLAPEPQVYYYQDQDGNTIYYYINDDGQKVYIEDPE